MSSIDISNQPAGPSSKICVGCGIDVSHRKRQKNRAGRYFCESCVERLTGQQRQAPHGDRAVHDIASNSEEELLFCEVCGCRATAEHMSLCNGHVVCRECEQSGAAKVKIVPTVEEITAEVGDLQRFVAATNWIMLVTIFTGIFLPPVGIPMQAWSMVRLLRLAGRPRQVNWICMACLPLFGLIPVWLMVDRAGQVVNRGVNPFDRWQRERSSWLTTVAKIGGVMSVLPIFALTFRRLDWFTFDAPIDIFEIICFASVITGIALVIYAEVCFRSHKKEFSESGGAILWFSRRSDASSRDSLAPRQKGGR